MTERWKPTFATDTATLAIFDLVCLKHRLDDDPDWWCAPAEAVVALNSGKAAFVDLGADGQYELLLSESALPEPTLSFCLDCPSGQVFVGAGEETTSDEMEPEGDRGGGFLRLTPGPRRFSLRRSGTVLYLHSEPCSAAVNAVEKPPVLR